MRREDELKLLEIARSGNNDAVNELLASHKHLVSTIARKYYLIGGDKDDLIQEGMIGLFKAISSFDPERNDSFAAYASTLIAREIISAIRHANTHAQQVLSESVLIDSDDELPDIASPESDLISEENTSELTQEINNHLSVFERQVVEYYLKGYNYIDIAKVLNKPSKSIDNALSRIKKKLEFLKERL